MIWKTKTHEFSATVCQKTGRPCAALAQMARALADAMATAQPATNREFEVEGSGELAHCADGCTARFRADHAQIRVFCGIGSDTPAAILNEYADLMFGQDTTFMPAGVVSELPCAMLQVTTFAAQPASDAQHQLGA